MGMDVDSVFAKEYLDKIRMLVSNQEHGEREGICNDIIEFHGKMEEKWGKKESDEG
jgi:hypothetical protein